MPLTFVASLIPHRNDMLEKTRRMRHMDTVTDGQTQYEAQKYTSVHEHLVYEYSQMHKLSKHTPLNSAQKHRWPTHVHQKVESLSMSALFLFRG